MATTGMPCWNGPTRRCTRPRAMAAGGGRSSKHSRIGICTGQAPQKGNRMSKIDVMVQDFLAQKTVAVVGVSNKRETGCNSNYEKFKSSGYKVYAVNPHTEEFKGDKCYPNLK